MDARCILSRSDMHQLQRRVHLGFSKYAIQNVKLAISLCNFEIWSMASSEKNKASDNNGAHLNFDACGSSPGKSARGSVHLLHRPLHGHHRQKPAQQQVLTPSNMPGCNQSARKAHCFCVNDTCSRNGLQFGDGLTCCAGCACVQPPGLRQRLLSSWPCPCAVGGLSRTCKHATHTSADVSRLSRV